MQPHVHVRVISKDIRIDGFKDLKKLVDNLGWGQAQPSSQETFATANEADDYTYDYYGNFDDDDDDNNDDYSLQDTSDGISATSEQDFVHVRWVFVPAGMWDINDIALHRAIFVRAFKPAKRLQTVVQILMEIIWRTCKMIVSNNEKDSSEEKSSCLYNAMYVRLEGDWMHMTTKFKISHNASEYLIQNYHEKSKTVPSSSENQTRNTRALLQFSIFAGRTSTSLGSFEF